MDKLNQEIQTFIAERNWSRYHSPKNLAMALSVEVAELLEIFQWLDSAEAAEVDPETLEHIEEEIGDVMIYLSTLAMAFAIDPISAARQKLRKNRKKYPPGEQDAPVRRS